MKHDTGLLTKATQLAADAYKETIPGAQKFENSKTSTTAFVLKTAEADYCIWRGTESMRDWRFNAMFWPWPVKRAFVHYGFYRHQQAVWKELRKILNPGKKTIFAGHSLGGQAEHHEQDTVSAARPSANTLFCCKRFRSSGPDPPDRISTHDQ